MHPSDHVHFVTFSPRFVTFVKVHHARSSQTCATHEECKNEGYYTQDAVRVTFLFPVNISVDLETAHKSEGGYNKT